MRITTEAHPRATARAIAVCVIFACGCASAQGGNSTFAFGSAPSEDELRQFVSPLPDGRGLPPGSGTVEQGRVIYTQQCLACHGDQLQGGQGDRLIGGRGSLVNDSPS